MYKNHIKLRPQQVESLYQTFINLKNSQDCERFLSDLCTPTEIHAMADRWHIAKELSNKTSQCDIVKSLRVSIVTVTRVSRCFKNNLGGYRRMLKLMNLAK